MAEEQLSCFKEQIPEEEAPLVDQHVLDQVLAEAPSLNPETQDAAPLRQSPEPAQQSPLPVRQSTEPVDGQAPPAGTSSTGPSEECRACGKSVCTCFPVRETQSAPISVNNSPAHTQGQATTSSAPQPDVNVPTIDPTHTNQTPLPVLATEPDQPQARCAAALRRAYHANTAVQAAYEHSIDAHVTLRFAQAHTTEAEAFNSDQVHVALLEEEDARRAALRADRAFRESLLEFQQAHVAYSHAESDARHAAYAHASTSLAAFYQRIPSRELYSKYQQQPSQNDGDQEEERWKGKGRAEDLKSSSADQGKEILEGKNKAEKSAPSSADGKRTRNSLEIVKRVKRVFRRRVSNEQHSLQQPGRSQAEPTFQSPNPSHNASSSQPVNQGLVIANGSGTDNSQSPGDCTSPGDSQTPASSQTLGSSQSPDTTTNPSDVPPSGSGNIPPGGSGKKPGIRRKMSSDLLSKLKRNK